MRQYAGQLRHGVQLDGLVRTWMRSEYPQSTQPLSMSVRLREHHERVVQDVLLSWDTRSLSC